MQSGIIIYAKICFVNAGKEWGKIFDHMPFQPSYTQSMKVRFGRKNSYHGIVGQPAVSLLQDGRGSKAEETPKLVFCIYQRFCKYWSAWPAGGINEVDFVLCAVQFLSRPWAHLGIRCSSLPSLSTSYRCLLSGGEWAKSSRSKLIQATHSH